MKWLWNKIPEHKRRFSMVVVCVVTLVALVYLLTPKKLKELPRDKAESIRHVLTDANTREVNIQSLSTKLRQLESENLQLQRDMAQMKGDILKVRSVDINHSINELPLTEFIPDHKTTWGLVPILASYFNLLRGSITQETIKNLDQKEISVEELQKMQRKNEQARHEILPTLIYEEDDKAESRLLDVEDVDALYQEQGSHSFNQGLFNHLVSSEHQSINGTDHKGLSYYSHAPSYGEPILKEYQSKGQLTIRTLKAVPKTEPQEPSLRLLAGSILSGTLITGMDAPTHDNARKEPFPALLRIEKEAILPNHQQSDIRYCFLVMGGYGDLSSERAYLRAETLSCFLDDGKVIESHLEAYAVGEDGKAGIRGRLVSKQGQLIAKSMMAGFLQGLAGAFDVNPVPSIQTTEIGQRPIYQNMMNQQALEGATLKGGAKALDRVAKFYLDMAQNIFPVIEIDAARQIEMIVTRGISF